jgi:arginine decarboxylase
MRLALDQNRTPLFDALKKYIDDSVVPFHVPGHKQGAGLPEFREYFGGSILKADVNGLDGLDYYNNPSDVILEAEELMAEAYGAESAFFLVNGTTSGVQAMILAACPPESKLILPRNAHKSSVSGLILSGAVPVYVQPEFHAELGIAMGVTAGSFGEAITREAQAGAVFLINPTYYGMSSDLKTIAALAHDKGLSVLVDEAHGAHLPFHKAFPLSAMAAGADMSAMSVHKTAGSLTQSSALLAGTIPDPKKIRQALNLLNTSSASYILLCSLDIARKQLALKGRELLETAVQLAREAREEINAIDGLYAFGRELIGAPGCFGFDETKLSIHVGRLGLSGYEVESQLRKKYNIQVELSDMRNVLAVVTLGDRGEHLKRLVAALKDIAGSCHIKKGHSDLAVPIVPELVVTPRQAFFGQKKRVRLDASTGEIAGEMIMAYPPGIPVLGIGERITDEIIDYITLLKSEKCQLQGASDPHNESIRVLA